MDGAAGRTLSLTIKGPLRRGDLPGLFARTCALLSSRDVDELRCELAGVRADAVAVDALARLALAARRSGARVRLSGASEELLALVCLMGLTDVLGVEPKPRDAAAGRTAGRSCGSKGRT